jgi:hypothetical protein
MKKRKAFIEILRKADRFFVNIFQTYHHKRNSTHFYGKYRKEINTTKLTVLLLYPLSVLR